MSRGTLLRAMRHGLALSVPDVACLAGVDLQTARRWVAAWMARGDVVHLPGPGPAISGTPARVYVGGRWS